MVVSWYVGQLPSQGNFVVEKRQKINSWASIREEKWRRGPKKSEEKVQVHREGNIKGLHIPRLMDGGKGKIKKCFVVKRIDHQRYKKENNSGTKEDGGVCSPM